MNGIRSRKGMTLVELIVALALVGMILAAAMSIIMMGYQIQKKVTTDTQLYSSAVTAEKHLLGWLKTARQIAIASTPPDASEGYETNIKVDGGFAASNGITAEFVQDLSLRVDDVGGKAMLFYTVTAALDERTYSLDGGLALNNITVQNLTGQGIVINQTYHLKDNLILYIK